jgi:hypothetical protein
MFMMNRMTKKSMKFNDIIVEWMVLWLGVIAPRLARMMNRIYYVCVMTPVLFERAHVLRFQNICSNSY